MSVTIDPRLPPEFHDYLRKVGTHGLDYLLGLHYTFIGPDRIEATLTVDPKHYQPAGLVHGGVFCSIVESLGSFAGTVWLWSTGIGGSVVGVNNNTDFLRPAQTGVLHAIAEPIHRGRRQQLWDIHITNDDGKLMSRGHLRLQNITHGDGQPTPGLNEPPSEKPAINEGEHNPEINYEKRECLERGTSNDEVNPTPKDSA